MEHKLNGAQAFRSLHLHHLPKWDIWAGVPDSTNITLSFNIVGQWVRKSNMGHTHSGGDPNEARWADICLFIFPSLLMGLEDTKRCKDQSGQRALLGQPLPRIKVHCKFRSSIVSRQGEYSSKSTSNKYPGRPTKVYMNIQGRKKQSPA